MPWRSPRHFSRRFALPGSTRPRRSATSERDFDVQSDHLGERRSEHADRALEYAKGLAEASSAKLIATHVREITVGRAAGYPVQFDEDEIERKIHDQAKALNDSGIETEYDQPGAVVGGAAHAIADLAASKNADLIVVGTRGQGPVSGVLLGSVTNRLLHVAGCPVLAIPLAP